MKFHEKRHYSQKYIFSDTLEEDYKLHTSTRKTRNEYMQRDTHAPIETGF